MHLRKPDQDLTGLEGGQRLAGPCGMPDVPVFRGILHPVDDRLRGVKLIGAQNHERLAGLVQHDVLGDHPAQVAGIQEQHSELVQLGDQVVLPVGPVKGLLKGLVPVVGVIFCVNPVADDEDLYELEQPVGGPERVTLVAVHLVKGFLQFDSPAFELDLDKRKSVDQDGDVIPVLPGPFHGDLMGNLEEILAPVIQLEEFKIETFAIVAGELHPVPEDFGAVEDIALVQVVQHPGELIPGQLHLIVPFQLPLKVDK